MAKQLQPRKKFDMNAEVKNALARFKHQYTDTWSFVPDKRIVKQIMDLHAKQHLHVQGMQEPDVYLTRHELLRYAHILPPPVLCQRQGKKLKSTPLFSLPFIVRGILPAPIVFKRENLLSEYERVENLHKSLEDHHPDGLGWGGGTIKTMECVFDVFSCLLRSHSVQKAWFLLLVLLKEDKFANLDAKAILLALLHISIRGVSESNKIREFSEWRNESLSQDLIFKYLEDYENQIPPISIYTHYHQETMLHSQLIHYEMKCLRVNQPVHDKTKLSPEMLTIYSAYWGCYMRLSEQNQYRFKCGIYGTVNSANPTMFSFIGSSVGKSAAEAAFSDPTVSDVLNLTRTLPDNIQNTGKLLLDDAETRTDSKIERLENLASTFLSGLNAAGDVVASKLEDKSNNILANIMEQIPTAFGPAISSLEALRSLIDEKMKFVEGVISSFFGTDTKLAQIDLFSAFQSYIMYINVESRILKSFFIFSILKSLGLTTVLLQEAMRLWSILIGGGEEQASRPTSDFFEWIATQPQNICSIIGGLFVSIVSGASMTTSVFLSFVKQLGDKMRGFHFIGAGLGGIAKIIEYGKKFFNFVVEWIALNVFGKTPEKEQLTRESMSLMIRIRYFETEQGLTAIRMNESMRVEAEKLMPKMQTLLLKFKENPEYRSLYYDLEKLYRPCKNITDFVSRLRAASNFQPTMFHIQFVGRPGIGKSTIIKNVSEDLSQTLWSESAEGNLYAFNTNLEYFDGYNQQKIFYIDDIYKIQDPAHLTTSMFLITNTPVILPMANLTDKGIQLQSEIMLSTTNTAYPVGKDILCIEAVHRRRHMLVETCIDKDVLDPSLGQFEFARYIRKYRAANCTGGDEVCARSRDKICKPCADKFKELPHLTFNLLRPVPSEMCGATPDVMKTGVSEHDILQEYAERLNTENFKISTASGVVDPTFYYSDDNRPPEGIQLPCIGWTYRQLITNAVLRYKNFRSTENTYSSIRKFEHVEHCLLEIDALLGTTEQIKETDKMKFTIDPTPGKIDKRLMEQWLCAMSHPFGTEDDIGLASASGRDLPELRDLNLEEMVNNIVSENNAAPTMERSEEMNRRRDILHRYRRTITPPQETNRLKMKFIGDQAFIPIISHYTQWEHFDFESAENAQCLWQSLLLWQDENFPETPILFGDGGVWQNIKYLSGSIFDLLKTKIHLSEAVVASGFSQNLVYPDHPAVPSELRGKDSGWPIAFFTMIKKVGVEWCLDVTKYHSKTFQYKDISVKATTTWNGNTYRTTIPADIAFAISQSTTFQLFVALWDEWSESMKEVVLREANWRNKYTGSYTYEKMSLDCTNIFKKYYYKTMSVITTPFRYLIDNFPVLTVVAGGMLAFFTVRYILTSVAELLNPTPTSKVLHRGPQSNIIYHGRQTASQSDVSGISQLINPVLQKNVRKVRIGDSNFCSNATALFSQQYMIVNKHVVERLKDEYFDVFIYLYNNLEPHHYLVELKNIEISDEGDLAIVYSRNWPSFRKIEHHFITDKLWTDMDSPTEAAFLSHSETGTEIRVYNGLRKIQDLHLANKDTKCKISRAFMFQGSTMGGKSGSPVITRVQGAAKILGIQAWEVDVIVSPKIAVQVITLDLFDKLRNSLLKRIEEQPIVREDHPLEIFDAAPTSAFQNMPLEGIEYTDEHRVGLVGKNQIQPSIIFEQLQNYGIITNRTPAAMHLYDKRLYHQGAIHPLASSLGKYFKGHIRPFNPITLSYVKESISKYVRSRLDKSTFRFLHFDEAITGTREDGSNPMNLKSSPGIPFIFEQHQRKGKKDYLEISEEGELCFIDDKFLEQYNIFLDKLSNRRLDMTRAYDFPKDELRPIVKALGSETSEPKTRTVTCMNLNYIIAWRQATLDFWAAMHRAADGTFSFCPGINPEGPEWNAAFHYLSKHPHAVDFDVSNWDGFLRPELLFAAGDLIKDAVRNKKSSAIIDSILHETMFSYIQYDNIVYRKNRGLVSGFPGTAEMNTLSHWFLIFYIYLELCYQNNHPELATFESFNRLMSILVYGDDIIITFSDSIKEWFNGKTIQAQYEYIGYPVTAADKSGEISKYKPLVECKFLKSCWREFRPYYYIRQLDLDVAHDLVMWTRSKLNAKSQFYENYVDSLRVAFGHGREVFDDFNNKIQRALLDLGYDSLGYTYEDFEIDYCSRYLSW